MDTDIHSIAVTISGPPLLIFAVLPDFWFWCVSGHSHLSFSLLYPTSLTWRPHSSGGFKHPSLYLPMTLKFTFLAQTSSINSKFIHQTAYSAPLLGCLIDMFVTFWTHRIQLLQLFYCPSLLILTSVSVLVGFGGFFSSSWIIFSCFFVCLIFFDWLPDCEFYHVGCWIFL